MARAIFLDRDGILNRNVFYPDTNAWESPRSPESVELTSGIARALLALRAAGYLLIVVSNQPNAAKGKCSLEALHQVHARVVSLLGQQDVILDAHFLCLHHPDFTGACVCRKPSPFFLLQASAEYGIALERSWMIGDRHSDVACGRAAGTSTVWINTGEGILAPGPENPADLVATNVHDAVARLLQLSSTHQPPAQS